MASRLQRALPAFGVVAALTLVSVAVVTLGIVRWEGMGTFVFRFTLLWSLFGTPIVMTLAGPRTPPGGWKRTILWATHWAVGGGVAAYWFLRVASASV